jgi:CBS domain-containing protein
MVLTVKDLMHGITVVDGGISVAEAAKKMLSTGTTVTGEVGSVLVGKGDVPIGIVTERDILKLVAKGLDPKNVKLREIMNTPLITIPSDATIEEASEIMTKRMIRRLPVVEEDKIVGIITTRDITRGLTKSFLTSTRESERPRYTQLP